MAQDPFFGSNPVVSNMRQQLGRRLRDLENAARHASSFNTVTTKGSGLIHIPHVQTFECRFVERPLVAYGTVLTGLEGPIPRCDGSVFHWQQDSHGFYVGAWVYLIVDCEIEYVIEHDFTFSGIALKGYDPAGPVESAPVPVGVDEPV